MEILDMNLTEGKPLLAGTLRKVKNGELTAEGIIARLSRESLEGWHTKGNLSTVRSSLLVDWSAKASHEERSTSIKKQLVFQYPFCRKTSCNRVLERFLVE
jgi:hypothetical protein